MKTATKIIISILASLVLCLNAAAITDALKVKIINGTSTDETVIRFLPTATAGFDGSWDAYKLFSTSLTVPAIYTRIDSVTELSVNALPSDPSPYNVALYTHIKVNATYTLQAIELGAGFQPGVSIVLEDLVTGMQYNFRGGQSVTLPMTTNTLYAPNRFVIHFIPAAVMSVSIGNVICNGQSNGSITATKPGISSWNYELKDSLHAIISSGTNINETTVISGLAAGTYTLYTSGATVPADSSTISIAEPAPVIADFASSTDTVSLSSAVIQFINNSSNALYYSWDFADGIGTDSTSPSHQYTSAGIFNVTLVAADSMGCNASTSRVIVVNPELSTGISDYSQNTSMFIFPEDGGFRISIDAGRTPGIGLVVYNSLGQKIAEQHVASGNLSEAIYPGTSGTYIVQAIVDNRLQSRKISFTY